MILAVFKVNDLWPYLGLISFLGAGWIVFRGSAARESNKWQTQRINELKEDLTGYETRMAKMETENRVLTEKVTQAAAVQALDKRLQQMHEENREEHMELAALLGTRLRVHDHT